MEKNYFLILPFMFVHVLKPFSLAWMFMWDFGYRENIVTKMDLCFTYCFMPCFLKFIVSLI